MKSKFEFLEDQFPELAKFGKKAEESLNFDNNICLLNLGRIAEKITEILCYENNLENQKIEELSPLGIIDENIELKIKTLLEIEDDAEKNNYDSEMACSRLMTTAQELCEWFILEGVKNKFDFLAELFPPDFISPLVNIAELGREAEENLHTNTRYCLICLGDVGEAIADYLINANSISTQRDHLDKINVLFNMGVLQNDKKNRLHNLRIARNNAVHERYNNTYTSEEDAAKILDDVLEMCQWLFKIVMRPTYIVKGRISEINDDSISVLIGKIPAEVPLNEIPTDENGNSLKDSYIKGKKYIFKVVENENDKIILSLINAEQEYNAKIADVERQYSKYKPGQEVNAKILRISNSSGAFVELKNGLQARIPSNEIIARKLYSTDAAGTKHIKYEVKARVKSVSPSQYPPMLLTLREISGKTKSSSDQFSEPAAAQKMNDLEFIEICKRSKADTVLKALDKKGANPNAKNSNNLTALMEASRFNHHSIVKLLIDAGADVNARNQQGNTPLHFAAMQNGPNAIEELIKHGADVDALNKNNKKPIDYARSNKKINTLANIMDLLAGNKIETENQNNETPDNTGYNNEEVLTAPKNNEIEKDKI
ncbi:MAG: ankyrin repeat domain-containing protein, partial [Synergistaceae bacterium]|nr:ankyrin repeat domain-containing protein [Synergistaceae bacterium]